MIGSLRELSFLLRVAATCFLLVLAIGYAAALFHVVDHVGKKDNEPELTHLDLVGTYHGVNKQAGILVALEDEKHQGWTSGMSEQERDLLVRWLQGELGAGADPIASGYADPPDGSPEDALVPADVLDQHCTRCHRPGATEGGEIGESISLTRWPNGVDAVAYSKELAPISKEILAQSTHAHALSMPAFAVLICGMLLLTRWPRGLRHGLVAMAGVGLLLDLAGMWLARSSELWVNLGIILGGAMFGIALGLAWCLCLLDLWLPRRA